MKILALDTSALVAAVAVMEDDRLLAEYMLNHRKTHSQQLVAMIREVLASLELAPKDIDVFAASTGPGSFTGLRIGVTTVKAMAYATGKPVVSVPTLDAIAYNIPMNSFTICPVMDARNNQVYTALYDWDENGQKRITDYMGIPVSELVQLIKDMGKKVILPGMLQKCMKNILHRSLETTVKLLRETFFFRGLHRLPVLLI